MSKRILIFIVAYNAEKTLTWVLDRIPRELLTEDNEILIIDDSSKDKTFEVGLKYRNLPEGIQLTLLRTPINQGYGGNQKLGYRYAIERGYQVVVLVHGDGQYPPEMIGEIAEPILTGESDAVFGSRMMKRGDALKGGMPLYKYIGNTVLTTFQNWCLGSQLSEFHSGFRAYSVPALSEIPFEHNTNDFHFDTEIIIQLFRKSLRVSEIPIPTHYGDEICHVNGFRYALDVVRATLMSRIQNLGLLYRRKFDVGVNFRDNPYEAKLDFDSSHSRAVDSIKGGEHVLDLGCGEGIVARALGERGCVVSCVDKRDIPKLREFAAHYEIHDLNNFQPSASLQKERFDTILLLDILEHLNNPEEFLDHLRRLYGAHTPRIIITTGNIGFVLLRLAHVLGQFNYGPRGILDIGHKRLFNFRNLLGLLEESGYAVIRTEGIPAPFPLVLRRGRFSRLLLTLNRLGISLSKTLFSYQIYIEARITPSVQGLLGVMLEEPAGSLSKTVSGEDPSTKNDSPIH
ncbi:MAG: glycosyltransferase [Bdellovibrionota bacterium]